MLIKEAIDLFLKSSAGRYTQASLATYKSALNAFEEYLESRRLKLITSVRLEHAQEYIDACTIKGFKAETVRLRRTACVLLSKFCRKRGLIKADFGSGLDSISVKRTIKPIMTTHEVERLLDSCDIDSDIGIRNNAIIKLLYSSALRVSELCNLMIEDVSEAGVLVRSGKGSKTRKVPITKSAYAAIRLYLRNVRSSPEKGYLFLSKPGMKMQPRTISYIIEAHAKKAGLKHVTPHSFRHACATHLLDAGADLRVIQEILGHEKLSTTQIYTQVSASRMQESFTKHHPMERQSVV